MKQPTARRAKADLQCAELWRTFYHSDGRVALAALLTEFDIYTRAPNAVDLFEAGRREGQRDVLLRIVNLIGLKPENLPADAWEDTDILDRMMRQK